MPIFSSCNVTHSLFYGCCVARSILPLRWASLYVLQFLMQYPDSLRCNGKQCMITLVLFGKPGIFHGSPPAVTQVTHHPAVECVVPGHLGDRDVQQIIQPLEDPEPKCNFRQLRIFLSTSASTMSALSILSANTLENRFLSLVLLSGR